MELPAKSKARSCNSASKSWGMGFLLIFFPPVDHKNNCKDNAIDLENDQLFSSSNTKAAVEQIKSKGVIHTTARYTISICAILVLISLLIFTFSTLEHNTPFRICMQKKTPTYRHYENNADPPFALQKMGVLYRRGTKAMHELVVAHVHENVSVYELGLFLRLFHRSSLSSKADLAFIFESSLQFEHVIKEEDDSFIKLINYYVGLNGTAAVGGTSTNFDVTMFMKSGRQNSEPIWGKKTRRNVSNTTESAWLSYGSVVGFEASELDPENSLSGFLDHVPLSLRRWACYTTLLGRVRRVFKHVMLVNVKNALVLGDPLTRIRTLRPVSVLVMKNMKHGKGKMMKTHCDDSFNPDIIMGGTRGIRRFSDALLTEIVRIAMQYKLSYALTEQEVLNQLVKNELIFRDSVNLIKLAEPVPEASELFGSSSNSSGCSLLNFDYSIVRCSNCSNDLNLVSRKDMCSCEMNSYVYKDCQNSKKDISLE